MKENLSPTASKKNLFLTFMLVLVLATASFFRLWRLNTIPPGIFSDVAANGYDALVALEKGNFKVFYPEIGGREGLFINLTALSFSIFGASAWSIKVVSAMLGILTVFGLYLLTKELFKIANHYKLDKNNEIVAILSSFLLATSFWHTNFSRIGLRAISLPFAMVFSFYFLFKGLRTKKALYYILAGIFFGLGFYTYTSFRFTALLLPVIFIPAWLKSKKESSEKKILTLLAYFLMTTFIVSLPIGFYFLQNPNDFIKRAADVSVFKEQSPIGAIFVNFTKHLVMFNFSGDKHWQHNLPGSPELSFPVGIFFLIGVFVSIKKLRLSFKDKNYSLIILYGLLLAWFFIMLLPGILTNEGIPHSLRTIGTLPVVYIFAGMGVLISYNYLAQKTKDKNWLLLALIFVLIISSVAEFQKYFIKWGQSPNLENTFFEYQAKVGEYLNSLPPDVQKYVLINYFLLDDNGNPSLDSMKAISLIPIFIEKSWYFNQPKSEIKEPTIYLPIMNINDIKLNNEYSIYKSGRTVIVPIAYNQELLEKISETFSGGKIENRNGVWSYEIK